MKRADFTALVDRFLSDVFTGSWKNLKSIPKKLISDSCLNHFLLLQSLRMTIPTMMIVAPTITPIQKVTIANISILPFIVVR